MYRNISITAVMNGFICQVGCQRVVFRSGSELLVALDAYLRDPEGTEKEFSQHPNARHTLGGAVDPGQQQHDDILSRQLFAQNTEAPVPPTMGQTAASNPAYR
jgi:hypothetical protein